MSETRETVEARVAAEGPFAYIQWKGTDVCMDVHCSCGAMGHVDADFTYYVQCGACKKVYAVCANVRLVEVSDELADGRAELAVVTP